MTDPAAAAVLAEAFRQLGKTYVLGAEGPDRFDCSGLVYWCFTQTGNGALIGGTRKRAAGYTRWATDRGLFTRDLSRALPGDLIVYAHNAGGHVSHIAFFTGGNPNALSAENPRDGIKRHRAKGLNLHLVGVLLMDYPTYGHRQGGDSNPSQPGDPEIPPGGGDPSPPNPTHTLHRSHRAALRAAPRHDSDVLAWAEFGDEIRSVDGLSGGPYAIRQDGVLYPSHLWLVVESLNGSPLQAPAYTAALLWVPIPAEPPSQPT